MTILKKDTDLTGITQIPEEIMDQYLSENGSHEEDNGNSHARERSLQNEKSE